MASEIKQIPIPDTDLWDTLFSRSSKPFPDSQKIYTNPVTNQHYTFTSLRSTSIVFASVLHHNFRFRKGSVLALFLQNHIDTPAITFGAHYVGGLVSPANPAYTPGELVHHLKDSEATILVTQESLLKTALAAADKVGIKKENIIVVSTHGKGLKAGTEKSLRSFDALVEEAEKSKRDVKKVKLNPKKDLAYLVYSSGTTGLPKGVMLTHENAASNLLMLHSSEGDILDWKKERVLSVLPFYHIYGLQCLVHFPAYFGLPTYVMQAFDLKAFCSIIQNNKITYTYVAPPVLAHLAKNQVIDEYDLSSLTRITSGAAPLTEELINAVHKRLGIEVKQAYGLSETSPAVFIQKQWDNGLGSCGPPLPNQIIKYIDPEGNPVKQGEPGEIWIKGPHVFVGYKNNKKATDECMTPDGFFKTGDIAYTDSKGNMYITDRVKELIKYKGFQVAPAELEGILMGSDLVDDVAVVGKMDETQATEVPVAFVVPRKGVKRNKESEEIVVKFVAERLAKHKWLRGGVVWVDEVPKSASGKILRRVLKDKLKEVGKKDVIKAKL